MPRLPQTYPHQRRAFNAEGVTSLLRQWMADPALYRQECADARRQAPLLAPHLFDPDLIKRFASTDVVLGNVEPENCVEPVRRRKRAPNVVRYIKQARKAGDKGPVRVEITDSKGRTVTVTSEQNTAQHVDAARSMWDKKLAH